MEFKVQRNGKVVCFLSLKKTRVGDLEIEMVKTEPEYRNKGLATILLKKAITVSQKDCRSLVAVLDPEPGGLTYEQEVSWLKKHGFKSIRRYDMGGYFKPVMIRDPISYAPVR